MDEYSKVTEINLAQDNENNNIVLLKTAADGLTFISIGDNEAHSIMLELNGKKYARPLTHDLIKTILTALKCTVEKAMITHIENNTYYAILRMVSEDKTNIFHIDCRPSDAVAISLRFKAEIYVNKKLLTLLPQ